MITAAPSWPADARRRAPARAEIDDKAARRLLERVHGEHRQLCAAGRTWTRVTPPSSSMVSARISSGLQRGRRPRADRSPPRSPRPVVDLPDVPVLHDDSHRRREPRREVVTGAAEEGQFSPLRDGIGRAGTPTAMTPWRPWPPAASISARCGSARLRPGRDGAGDGLRRGLGRLRSGRPSPIVFQADHAGLCHGPRSCCTAQRGAVASRGDVGSSSARRVLALVVVVVR